MPVEQATRSKKKKMQRQGSIYRSWSSGGDHCRCLFFSESPLDRQQASVGVLINETPDQMKGVPHDLAVHAQAVMHAITVIACTSRSCGVSFIRSDVS